MYKKNLNTISSENDLENKYLKEFYSGFSGFLFKLSHQNLEKNLNKNTYSKILEIGAGPHPQINYIKHNFNEYYVLETSDFAVNFLKQFKKIKVIKYEGKNIPFEDNFFDRIIIAHTLEHIEDFECFIIQIINKLKFNGILSIALPTDPGVLWRYARFCKKNYFSKNLGISNLEYDYIMASEHINSVFSIRNVLLYHYKKSMLESFLPFKIKSLDLNLFYNVQIIKDF